MKKEAVIGYNSILSYFDLFSLFWSTSKVPQKIKLSLLLLSTTIITDVITDVITDPRVWCNTFRVIGYAVFSSLWTSNCQNTQRKDPTRPALLHS